MTGLGMPDGAADNLTKCRNPGKLPALTASLPAAIWRLFLAGAPTSINGAPGIQSALLNNNMAPCLITPLSSTPNLPTAKVGNVSATVTYAGWVADSIAGLYQVNLQLPANSATTFTQKADVEQQPTGDHSAGSIAGSGHCQRYSQSGQCHDLGCTSVDRERP